MEMDLLDLVDFYKPSHYDMYPLSMRTLYSDWTPRYKHSATMGDLNGVIHFGLQYFIKKYLTPFTCIMDSDERVVDKWQSIFTNCLGNKTPDLRHLQTLVKYIKLSKSLPLRIYSLPEGSLVPYGCPAALMHNTHPEFAWFVNYLETILSASVWLPTTSATTAFSLKKLLHNIYKGIETPDESHDYEHILKNVIPYQCHDFSFRGMGSLESAMLSGMGHLTSFKGTDTFPAIHAAMTYYRASLNVGSSIPATEHSVHSTNAIENRNEAQFFEKLIRKYSGPVSIVSDTWDYWHIVTKVIPDLYVTLIERRKAPIVIRPDSGVPNFIINGNPSAADPIEQKGTLRLLEELIPKAIINTTFGKLFKNIRIIYGDGMNYNTIQEILENAIKNGYSPENLVFGVGSFQYQYNTRDNHGFAMKAVACDLGGTHFAINKNPKTDSKKKSHNGIALPYWTPTNDGKNKLTLSWIDNQKPSDIAKSAFHIVFDGTEKCQETMDEIRERINSLL